MTSEMSNEGLKQFVEWKIDMFLMEYPKSFRDKVNIQDLAKKLLDSTFSFIIQNLYEVQRETEELLFMKRVNLVEKHLREVSYVKVSENSSFEYDLKVTLRCGKFQEGLKENDQEMLAEFDRMVSIQLDYFKKLGMPGFSETDNEVDETVETLRQKFLNQIYTLIVEIKQ